MATTLTLDVGLYFASGTTLGAYAFSGEDPDGVAPPVAATATAAVASTGIVAFTGLAEGTRYWVGTGLTPWRYVQASTAPASSVASGGVASVVTKTTTYTAVVGDLVKADATAGGFTVTLPASPTAGNQVTVKKIDASSNVVTVAAAGKTIDGDANATIVSRYAGATFVYDGTNWGVLSPTRQSLDGAPGAAGANGTNGTLQSVGTAGVLNNYYLASALCAPATTGISMAAGTLRLGTPIVAQHAMTINRLSVYLTAGGAGATLRFGLYSVDANAPWALTLASPWATLIAEADAAADASSLGQKNGDFATPRVIAAGTAFTVGLVAQGNAVTAFGENMAAPGGGSPWGVSSPGNALLGAVVATGVTGALPSTFTPSAFATLGGTAAYYRRSA